MRVNRLFSFIQNINIELEFHPNNFKKSFKRKFQQDKESILIGEIEGNTFKLETRPRKFFIGSNMTCLNATIQAQDKHTIINGVIELSDMMKVMIILGIIIAPILLIYFVIVNGIHLDIIGIIAFFFIGFPVTIYYQVFMDKIKYKRELKDLKE